MRIFDRKKKGFTLIELMVVISILAILVAISVTSYSTIRKNSRDSIRKADLHSIQNALEQYMGATKAYPPDIATLNTTSYLPKGVPLDPKSKCGYKYTAPSPYLSYELCADTETAGDFTCTIADCTACETNECLTQLQ